MEGAGRERAQSRASIGECPGELSWDESSLYIQCGYLEMRDPDDDHRSRERLRKRMVRQFGEQAGIWKREFPVSRFNLLYGSELPFGSDFEGSGSEEWIIKAWREIAGVDAPIIAQSAMSLAQGWNWRTRTPMSSQYVPTKQALRAFSILQDDLVPTDGRRRWGVWGHWNVRPELIIEYPQGLFRSEFEILLATLKKNPGRFPVFIRAPEGEVDIRIATSLKPGSKQLLSIDAWIYYRRQGQGGLSKGL